MSKIVRLGSILFVITAATGLALGGVQALTRGPIARSREQQKQEALRSTLPEAESFTELPSPKTGSIEQIFAGYRGKDAAGYSFILKTKGFGGPLKIAAGITAQGTLAGIAILESSETPGLGAKASDPSFTGQFRRKPAKKPLHVYRNGGTEAVSSATKKKDGSVREGTPVNAISGATVTSKAVADAVNDALKYWNLNIRKKRQKEGGTGK